MSSRSNEFTPKTKLAAWNRSGGNCERCTRPIKPKHPEYHHIKLVANGGDNSLDNCMVVCSDCHQELDNEGMVAVWKSNRIRKKALNLKPRKSRWMRDQPPKSLYSDIKFNPSGNPDMAPASQVAGGGPDCVSESRPQRITHFSRGAYTFRSITTSRLLIRKLAFGDGLHQVVNALNNKEHMRYSEQRHKEHSMSSQRKYLTDMESSGHLVLGIFVADPEKPGYAFSPTGTISCYVDPHNKLVDMGIMILPSAVGKGYGLEAWQAVLNWWLDPDGGRFGKVEAGCHYNNMGMRLVCFKSGMSMEGKRLWHFLENDKRFPVLLWGKVCES